MVDFVGAVPLDVVRAVQPNAAESPTAIPPGDVARFEAALADDASVPPAIKIESPAANAKLLRVQDSVITQNATAERSMFNGDKLLQSFLNLDRDARKYLGPDTAPTPPNGGGEADFQATMNYVGEVISWSAEVSMFSAKFQVALSTASLAAGDVQALLKNQ